MHTKPWEERYPVSFPFRLFGDSKARKIMKTLLWFHSFLTFSSIDFCLNSFLVFQSRGHILDSSSPVIAPHFTFQKPIKRLAFSYSTEPSFWLMKFSGLVRYCHSVCLSLAVFLVAPSHSQSQVSFTYSIPIIFFYVPSAPSHPNSSILYIHNSWTFYDFPFAFLHPLMHLFF